MGNEPGEEEAQQLFSIFEEKLLSILHLYADPKPGVVETVNALKEKGIRIGSTTGYTDKMMEIIIPITREKGYEPECWFQSGLHRTERTSLSLYDIPEYGDSWN